MRSDDIEIVGSAAIAELLHQKRHLQDITLQLSDGPRTGRRGKRARPSFRVFALVSLGSKWILRRFMKSLR